MSMIGYLSKFIIFFFIPSNLYSQVYLGGNAKLNLSKWTEIENAQF